MKKLAFFSFLLFCFSLNMDAQIRFGLRAGLSTSNLDKETIQQNGLSLAIKDAPYGYHFGLFARGQVGERFFIQPEVLFNSNTVDFTVNDLSDGLVNTVLNEKYQNLDIPLMAGFKFGPLRLQGGPVGHVHISSKSELGQIDNYKSRFNNFKLGYQAGIGLDIWKILIDLKYEGNLTKFGDHMVIGGEGVNFSQRPSRWVLTAGFSF